MAARAFQIQVQGLLDGTTPFVVPAAFPAPVGVVTKVDAGGGVNVGSFSPGAILSNVNAPVWIRSLQVEFAALTRAARLTYTIPGSNQPEKVVQDIGGAPPLMPTISLSPRMLVPTGATLNILTDDTDDTFAGSPVAGPHFVYFELEAMNRDLELASVEAAQGTALSRINSQSQAASSFQAVAASLTENLLVVQAPNTYAEANNTLMRVDNATVFINSAPTAAESMTFAVNRVLTGSGIVVTIGTLVVDATFANNSTVTIPINQSLNFLNNGDTLQLVRTYVAGVSLANTTVSLSLSPALLNPLP